MYIVYNNTDDRRHIFHFVPIPVHYNHTGPITVYYIRRLQCLQYTHTQWRIFNIFL